MAIAKALREWLPRVMQAIEPWMSDSDADKGIRWEQRIGQELEETRFGIFCLTPENLDSRWLNFEAGAIAKTVDKTYVCTYLCDLKPTDIEGPLSQFNHTKAEKEDTRKLIDTVNRALEAQALEADIVNEAFDLWWPRLEEKLAQLPAPGERTPPRKLDDMVEEILGLVRAQAAEADLRPNETLRRYLTTGFYGAGDQELKGFPDFERGRRAHAQSGTLAEIEAEYVSEILTATKGNKTEAARRLGISRKNLYERIARPHLGEQVMAEVNDEEDKLKDNLAE